MGCDIHMFLEKKVGDKWVMLKEVIDTPAVSRNYSRFAALAGVRGDGPDAKGLPLDVSDSVKLNSDEYGSDGHSHSYVDIDTMVKIIQQTGPEFIDEYERKHALESYFELYDSACKCCGRSLNSEYRVVFWFDN